MSICSIALASIEALITLEEMRAVVFHTSFMVIYALMKAETRPAEFKNTVCIFNIVAYLIINNSSGKNESLVQNQRSRWFSPERFDVRTCSAICFRPVQ